MAMSGLDDSVLPDDGDTAGGAAKSGSICDCGNLTSQDCVPHTARGVRTACCGRSKKCHLVVLLVGGGMGVPLAIMTGGPEEVCGVATEASVPIYIGTAIAVLLAVYLLWLAIPLRYFAGNCGLFTPCCTYCVKKDFTDFAPGGGDTSSQNTEDVSEGGTPADLTGSICDCKNPMNFKNACGGRKRLCHVLVPVIAAAIGFMLGLSLAIMHGSTCRHVPCGSGHHVGYGYGYGHGSECPCPVLGCHYDTPIYLLGGTDAAVGIMIYVTWLSLPLRCFAGNCFACCIDENLRQAGSSIYEPMVPSNPVDRQMMGTANNFGATPIPTGGVGGVRFCGSCGGKYEAGLRFCGDCGAPT